MLGKARNVISLLLIAVLAIVPLLVITILCVGCNRANNEPKPENIAAIPRYEELSALIGLSPDEAEQKLQGNLTETEPEYDDIYQTPITVELCDVTLYIQLAENSMVKKIDSILYCADYTNNNEKAAEDILKIARYLGDTIGENTQQEQWDLFEMTQEQVLEVFDGREQRVIEWDITPVATQSQLDYMELSSNVWETVKEGSRLDLIYGLELKVSNIEDTVHLQITIGPMRKR